MKVRIATVERWDAAVARARKEEIRVAKVNSTGTWIATSGTHPGTAYQLAVNNGVAYSCTCAAGTGFDPVCKHRAAWYLAQGLPTPEPFRSIPAQA